VLSVHETPPLELAVTVQTPAGATARWGRDDPNPALVPGDMSLSGAMPGGYERFSCVLQRDPQRDYPDLERLSKLTVLGLGGGTVAWQGRLEKGPDSGGFQSQVTPEGVGYQAALEDDNSAREIFLDGERGEWGGAALERKINYQNAKEDLEEPTSSGSDPAGLQAIVTSLTGKWERKRVCEAWYDSHGIPLGRILAYWELFAKNKIGDDTISGDPNWAWACALTTHNGNTTENDGSGSLAAEGPTGSANVAATAARYFALLQLLYANVAGGGIDGVEYAVYWPSVYVKGASDLTTHGTFAPGEPFGVLASDAIGYALGRWVPELARKIVPTTFVIPQLAFKEPTTVSEMVKQAVRFELPDWAVWESEGGYWLPPTFYLNPRGERAKQWRSRIGPAQLQETGPQIDRLWNGVVVQYTDTSGISRAVGPPGFAGGTPESEDTGLLDSSGENPVNQAGIRRWALLKMGTTTPEGAKTVGRVFLREQALLETSGQATLTGVVEDASGVLWPAWMVRAGDEIAFVDASEPGYRRIVSHNYNDSTRTQTIQLDQPPDGMTALLERLSVVLVPLGVG
jgi:hypothetical protein